MGKVFTHTNTLMVGKNSIKRHYLRMKIFYRHLNIVHITDANYAHAKRAFKIFDIQNLGQYHHLYV